MTQLPKKIEEPEKDEATLFLESLGIYGNFYYPDKQIAEPEDSYTALEVQGRILGIPDNLYPNIRSFINTGSCKNSIIQGILKSSGMKKLDEYELPEIQEELDYYTLDKNARIMYLRDLKFRAIMRKTLKFGNKKSMETVTEKLETYGVSVSWRVHEIKVLV